jgi:hypothetical protein
MVNPLAGASEHATRLVAGARWLLDHADVRVRLLIAPPGFGKTTALTAYAHTTPAARRCWVTIDATTTTAAVERAITDAFTREPRSVTGDPSLEVLLDDLHLATPELVAFINALVSNGPPHIAFVIAAQRRDLLAVGTWFAHGLVALCDQSRLALNATDAAELFAAHGIEHDGAAIDDLIVRTDGWPPAVVGTIRELLREPQPVAAAYARWRTSWSVPALDLVTALLEPVPPAERAAFDRLVREGTQLDQATLAVLHRYGFFVRFDAGMFTLMRWVTDLFPISDRGRRERPVLRIGLFGRFTASIGDVPISWARRRDANIIKYLALQPDGSATRLQLADVFWPDTARPLAMQNLRTACSTIRRAIGKAAGIERVDDYFVAGERLSLNRATVVCDVDRFRRHISLAQADDAAGALGDAIAHLRAAESLYGHGLFAGDVSEAAFFGDVRELSETYARLLIQLSAALLERGLPDLAREYAARAHQHGALPLTARARSQVDLRFAAS